MFAINLINKNMSKIFQIRVSDELEQHLSEKAEREFRKVPNLIVSILMKDMTVSDFSGTSGAGVGYAPVATKSTFKISRMNFPEMSDSEYAEFERKSNEVQF
jgi:hypothetical protein